MLLSSVEVEDGFPAANFTGGGETIFKAQERQIQHPGPLRPSCFWSESIYRYAMKKNPYEKKNLVLPPSLSFCLQGPVPASGPDPVPVDASGGVNVCPHRPARHPRKGVQTPSNPINFLGIQQGFSPATGFLYLPHPICKVLGSPNTACFRSECLGAKWWVQGCRGFFVPLSHHLPCQPFCLWGPWPASGPNTVLIYPFRGIHYHSLQGGEDLRAYSRAEGT